MRNYWRKMLLTATMASGAITNKQMALSFVNEIQRDPKFTDEKAEKLYHDRSGIQKKAEKFMKSKIVN